MRNFCFENEKIKQKDFFLKRTHKEWDWKYWYYDTLNQYIKNKLFHLIRNFMMLAHFV
jgi:hypothetical protein